MTNENNDKEKFYNDTLPFIAAVKKSKESLSWGEKTTFKCPVCGGTTNIYRLDCNGHVHAKCKKCKLALME